MGDTQTQYNGQYRFYMCKRVHILNIAPEFFIHTNNITQLGSRIPSYCMILLIILGFIIGMFGTLIGAGGGFILVPILILSYPELSPETMTAISIAIVAANAISGSIAYARSGRIDYKAGLLFAAFTIPGSILGVLSTHYIPRNLFNILFGVLLIALSVYLLVQRNKSGEQVIGNENQKRW